MKKMKLFVLAIVCFSAPLFSKTDGIAITKPQFPGGDKALVDYLSNSVKYPEEAQKQRWEGKTLVAFSVNEDGTITNARVLKSSWMILDNEALRVVKNMPKWIPATENGMNKKEMVVLPIMFDLTRKNIQY
ncbi:MAG: TonB [Bacteroidota bacterium]|nr:TonB [Bacteroidota bacterium]